MNNKWNYTSSPPPPPPPTPPDNSCHTLLPLVLSFILGYNVIHCETFLANPVTGIICKVRFVTVTIVAGSGRGGSGSGVTGAFCSPTIMHVIRHNDVRQVMLQLWLAKGHSAIVPVITRPTRVEREFLSLSACQHIQDLMQK